MKRLAVCPGSFDPVTLGHVDVALRARDLFGACEVVVMNNSEKSYLFSMKERFELCKAAFQNEKDVRVSCYEGMLYEFLQKKEGAVLVKGVRNEQDFLYEKNMAAFNFAHCGVETLYLDAKEEYQSLSSTLVREKILKKEDLSSFLPADVVKLLRNKL